MDGRIDRDERLDSLKAGIQAVGIDAPDNHENQVIILFFIAIYATIVLRNAWVCDDAYITLRTAHNFIHGLGLRWNAAERVQAFTNPLWLFLMAPFCRLPVNIYFPVLTVSLLFSLAAVALFAFRLAPGAWAAISGISILMLSDAFVDYSTSGLENPLTYLLLALIAVVFLKRDPTPRRLFMLSLLSSLLLLNRQDEVFLIAPLIAYSFWQVRGRPAIRAFLLGFSPVLAWEVFSLLYYGFLVPNTAYAKLGLGVGSGLMIHQGVCYLINSLSIDPLTVMVILAAIVIPFFLRDQRGIALSLGLTLTVLYIIRIGGCFMSGRHLAAPLFFSVCLLMRYLARVNARQAVVLMAGVGLIGLTSPRSPVYCKAEEGVNHEGAYLPNNIVDERLWYNKSNGLLNYDRLADIWPNIEWLAFGKRARDENQKVTIFATTGVYGYYAGPTVHVIDPHGLSDPLLARIPIVDASYLKPGHYVRQMPIGYKKSVMLGSNLIADPYLAELYDKLCIITKGDILSRSRLYEIVKFNLGVYDSLIDLYRRPHRINIHLADISEPKPAGTYWSDQGNIILDSLGVNIQLDTVWTASRLELSHDHNDKYCLHYLLADSLLAIDTVPPQSSTTGGLGVTIMRVPATPIATGYDLIRITPAEGDRMYSIGHLRIMPDSASP